MKNLRDYDKLTIAEKRRITPWASEYLARQEYAKKQRQKVMLAQRQIENDFIEGEDNADD